MIYANITYVTQSNLMFFSIHLVSHCCKLWKIADFQLALSRMLEVGLVWF